MKRYTLNSMYGDTKMSIYRMPTLTASDIRKIADKAVADVTRLKITTTQSDKLRSPKGEERTDRRSSADNSRMGIVRTAGKVLNNSQANNIQKSLAGSALSQSSGRGYFQEAFNKARKG